MNVRLRLVAALVCAAPLVSAQAIELRSGEVVFGRVIGVSDAAVRVAATHPTTGERSLARSELAPASLYMVLAGRMDASSAAAHLELAESSLRIGLPLHAIAEYREAARLDPARASAVEARVRAIREQVAGDLLAQAREALSEGEWPEAKLTGMVIAERYGDTAAAAPAREVVARALQTGRAAPASATAASMPPSAALKSALRHEAAADALELPATAGITAKERKRREQAVKHLEAAWKTVRDTDAQDGDVVQARARIKDKLGAQYLALATSHVQIRATGPAERWNAKACALDPDSGGCQHVQNLIIQARLTSGYGY
jgi:hypothetical protein